MDGIKVVNIGHCVIKNCSTGEVLWEGEMPAELAELTPASCAVDEYDALMRRLYLRLHRKLWNWIADETERTHKCVDKWGAFEHFGWNCIDGTCWCCKYVGWKRKYQPSKTGCENLCPIEWPDYDGCIWNPASPYHKLGVAENLYDTYASDAYRNPQKAEKYLNDYIKYAREIANLPERKW